MLKNEHNEPKKTQKTQNEVAKNNNCWQLLMFIFTSVQANLDHFLWAETNREISESIHFNHKLFAVHNTVQEISECFPDIYALCHIAEVAKISVGKKLSISCSDVMALPINSAFKCLKWAIRRLSLPASGYFQKNHSIQIATGWLGSSLPCYFKFGVQPQIFQRIISQKKGQQFAGMI